MNEVTPVIIYTDGACWNNPGPSGIGIFLQYRGHTREVGIFIGDATNNVAELMAIKKALELLNRRNLPVIIYTDSKYCVGMLMESWKARKNSELVMSIRELINSFEDVEIQWVKGHSGNPGNEKADQLATKAIKNRWRKDT